MLIVLFKILQQFTRFILYCKPDIPILAKCYMFGDRVLT